jgi:hypothetical protein
MGEYYVDVPDDLAKKLKSVDDDRIIAALEKVADRHTSDDELAPYDSVPEILQDDSLSDVEKYQLKLKAERRSDIRKR